MSKATLTLTAILIAVILPTMNANAANGGGSAIFTDVQDVTISWEWSVGGGATVTHHLRRFADLNNDGDFTDAGENTLVNTACNTIFACLVGTGSHTDPANIIIFKNGSADHRPGNYTFRSELQNGIGTAVDSYSFGFRITHDETCLPGSQCELQHQGTRTLVNATSQETRLLVNQSYANMTQNLTTHDANMLTQHNAQDLTHPVGCNGNCVNNISQNVTQNFTLFTSDCHGTGKNLCINGHTSNVQIDDTLKIVAMVGILVLLGWLATQKGSQFPILAILIGFLFIGFMLTFTTFLTSRAAWIILLGAPLLPMYFAAQNLNNLRVR